MDLYYDGHFYPNAKQEYVVEILGLFNRVGTYEFGVVALIKCRTSFLQPCRVEVFESICGIGRLFEGVNQWTGIH